MTTHDIIDTIQDSGYRRLALLTTAINLTITFGQNSVLAHYKGVKYTDLGEVLDVLEKEHNDTRTAP